MAKEKVKEIIRFMNSVPTSIFINRFENLGGKIITKTVESFEELSEYDLVVNCTGFGAKKLCHDNSLVPIRGQVFKVFYCYIYKVI